MIFILAAFSHDGFSQYLPGKASTLSDTVIANAFKQGKVNNCVSIALIKAAIGSFGLEKQFTSVIKTDSNFIFRLRNGEDIRISGQEITYSILNNAFIQKRMDSISVRIKQLADTCFALMCKKQQQLSNISFEAAVNKLNTGYKTADVALLLGLKFKIIAATKKNLSRNQHLIICNFYHTAYASGGIYDEALSRKGIEKIKEFKWYHPAEDNNYIPYLCDIKEGYKIVED